MADEIINDDTVANAEAKAESALDTTRARVGDVLDEALAESKSFLSRAQEALASATDTAVNAVKEHPIAAASIAAGAAAAVAGAAYGASKLLGGDPSDDDGATKG